MGKAKTFALGAVFAAAAGYVVGILTAPKSGKETRRDIKDAAQHGMTEAERQLKRLHTELTMLLNQANREIETLKGKGRDELEEVIKVSHQVREKARDVLSALHEGRAEDKDLEKAISDANKAIEHLKRYVKNVAKS